MQTRTYAELLSLIQSLSGVVFATLELGRIKALINRRALRAYRSTNYWPRFLKIGEERAVTSDVVPYTEAGKDSIDTYLRIHVQAPYVTTSVQEYDIMVTSDGATLVAIQDDSSRVSRPSICNPLFVPSIWQGSVVWNTPFVLCSLSTS